MVINYKQDKDKDMGKEITILKQWIRSATAEELREMAAVAKVSVSHIYRVASGERAASAETAAGIEAAGFVIARRQSTKRLNPLPIINRGDVCETCSNCPYFKDWFKD
jgi:hypothetical protein